MELDIIDTKGRSLGTRKAPMPPRQGEIVLLPAPHSDDRDSTAALDAAHYTALHPYEVRHVIWDILGQKVKLIVEETVLPTGGS